MVLIALWYLVIPGEAAQIHDAAEKGDLKVVKAMLAKSPKLVDSRNEDGRTALQLAAWNKQKAIVSVLLKKGADVNLKSEKNKRSPLHYACRGKEDLELVKMLIAAGAEIDSHEIDKETPLYYASYNGQLEVVKLLLGKGAALKGEYTKVGSSPLNYAIRNGKEEVARYLIQQGANVNEPTREGYSLIHMASFRCGGELVSMLIDKGLDVNAQAFNVKRTPLHYAAAHGNIKSAKAMIGKGANVNLADSDGRIPLHLSAYRGHDKMVALLLEAGSKFDIKETRKGATPLHGAAITGYADIAKLLFAKGADPNIKDNKGHTPLYYAAKYGHLSAAKLIKTNGGKADKLIKNFGPNALLKKQLKPGQALVWYMHHSGWAIKTQNHLLVFDFFNGGKLPPEPCLANGHVDPNELKDLNVIVFASHVHGDHYDPAIFEWNKSAPNVKYVMGFKPDKIDPNRYIYMAPREKKGIDGVKVVTIESNDSGVGFFVLADGVKIFHPGDHANKTKDFSGPFVKEIDFLAGKNLTADLMFAPVSGCGFGDLACVRNGIYYTAKKLSPKVIFPMHAGGAEHRYKEFTKEAKANGVAVPFGLAEYRGDVFIYNQGTLK